MQTVTKLPVRKGRAMSYRDYSAESFFAKAAKDSPRQPAAKVQELPPIPASLLRRLPDQPTPEYLEARASLGMPSTSGVVFLAACPWCGAARAHACVNPGTRQDKDQPHDARYEAAGMEPPRSGPMRQLAAEQAAESRAARPVV